MADRPGEEINKLVRGDLTVKFESRFRHKDGSYRWLSWTGVAGPGSHLCGCPRRHRGEGRGRTAEGRPRKRCFNRRRWKRSGN